MRRPILGVCALALLIPLNACSASEAPQPRERAARAAPVFEVLPFAPAATAALRIRSADRTVALTRFAHGRWVSDPGTGSEASQVMGEFEAELLPMLAYRRLEVTDAANPEYGLSPPAMVLGVREVTGQEHEVLIGRTTFSGGGFYSQRAGDDRLYLLVRHSGAVLAAILLGKRPEPAPNPDERAALEEATRLDDPEEVSNPWLAQVLEELGP